MSGAPGVDLKLMKDSKNVIVGFEVQTGFINTQGAEMLRLKPDDEAEGTGGAASRVHMAVPVVEFRFQMANGEARKPIVVTLGMIVPLIHALSEFGVSHSAGVRASDEPNLLI